MYVMKERLKGILIGGLAVGVVAIAVPVVARVAQENITVNFNNIRIAVDGVVVETEYEPFIFEGRTYLPTRDVANALGFDVAWEDSTNTVHLTSREMVNEVVGIAPNYPAFQPLPQEIPSIVADSNLNPQNNTPTTPTSNSQNNRPTNPAISLEQAIEIAYSDLARRGIVANFHSHSGTEWERGQWVWELEFRVPNAQRGRHVIEFYINVHTGDIVKFEQGD